jgi:hypothetical protein
LPIGAIVLDVGSTARGRVAGTRRVVSLVVARTARRAASQAALIPQEISPCL